MIFSGIILGLVSSLHCMGMCGPIAMMLPVNHHHTTKKTLQILLYHTGRLISYGFFGLIFGLLGRGLYLAGIQQNLSIFMGVMIISVAIIPERIFAKYNFSQPIYKILSKLRSKMGQLFKIKSNLGIFCIGILNGLLPCALVYSALFNALAIQDIGYSILFMICFGLGTIPLMSLVVFSGASIKKYLGRYFSKIITIILIVFGALLILRGLGLSIPYVSPSKLAMFITGNPQCN